MAAANQALANENRATAGRFLGAPSLGGRLALLNLLAWAGFFFWMNVVNGREPTRLDVLVPAIMILAFSPPIALPFLLPSHHPPPPTSWDIAATVGVIVVNSFAWGYGISFVVRRLQRVLQHRSHG